MKRRTRKTKSIEIKKSQKSFLERVGLFIERLRRVLQLIKTHKIGWNYAAH
jgi:hypothetical protein